MEANELKDKYNKFCENIGIEPNDLLNVFMTKAVNEQRVPFELAVNMPRQPEQGLADFVRKADPQECIALFEKESALNIAIILSLINEPATVSYIFENMPKGKQADTAVLMARGFSFSDSVVKAIAEDFMHKLAGRMETRSRCYGGYNLAANVMCSIPSHLEKEVIRQIEKTDNDVAETLRNMIFTFEDIVMLDDAGIQRLLREVDSTDLAKALFGVDKSIKDKIFRNMSKQAVKILREDMEFMGLIRRKDVDEAQEKIVGIIERLEDNGDIVIVRTGDDEDLVGID